MSEAAGEVSAEDRAAVAALLGRPPAGRFEVVTRGPAGEPVVIRNAPFLEDGTPMPTRYWLVGAGEREAVARLESAGGIREAEAAVPPAELAAAHARYAAEREAAIPAGWAGPRPSGGVGGTRRGVKCLHAHLAWYLAGGGDPVGRWVTHRLAGRLAGPVAAIDCGTNSTRLLVLDGAGRPLERLMTITRLGEGLEAGGRLSPAGVARTLAVLERYRAAAEAHGVVRLRAAATAAAREAADGAELAGRVGRVLEVPLEVLSGEEEAALAYEGATGGLQAAAAPLLLCDLGGGSTELVAGPRQVEAGAAGPEVAVSLPFGCVRLTERFLAGDPPAPGELRAARAHVRRLVEDALERAPALAGPRSMIGLAGTVAALCSLSAGLERYDFSRLHGARLRSEEVEQLLGELARRTVAERRALPGLEPERAPVIVGGALALAEAMAVLGQQELVHSERDLLDGLAGRLLAGG